MDIKEIQEKICIQYKITRTEMLCQSRKIKYAFPRQVAMYLCRLEGYSYPKIVFYFKRKDHTTAIHAFKKIEKMVRETKTLIII